MTVDIVIATWQRLDFTKACINHIVERTRTPYRIIVVDNGSTDGSQEWLSNCPHVDTLVLSEANYGIHWAWNTGLSLVRSKPYFVTTDNDILAPALEPDWLSRLVALMDEFPQYGAVACRPQVLVGERGDLFEDADLVVCRPWVGASLRIMRTDVVRMVGGWRREKIPGRDNEERWIADKLHQVGLSVGYARDIRCWHMFGENWGYPADMQPEEHGHRPVWPLPEHWDKIECDPDTWEPL